MSDLISRRALLEAMPKNDTLFSFDVRRVICDAPAVDAIPRWISVEGRLPEVDKRWTDKDTGDGYEYSADLLVYDGVRIRVAYYCHTTTWWHDSRYEDNIVEVTHWMHIPQPPKEDKK